MALALKLSVECIFDILKSRHWILLSRRLSETEPEFDKNFVQFFIRINPIIMVDNPILFFQILGKNGVCILLTLQCIFRDLVELLLFDFSIRKVSKMWFFGGRCKISVCLCHIKIYLSELILKQGCWLVVQLWLEILYLTVKSCTSQFAVNHCLYSTAEIAIWTLVFSPKVTQHSCIRRSPNMSDAKLFRDLHSKSGCVKHRFLCFRPQPSSKNLRKKKWW